MEIKPSHIWHMIESISIYDCIVHPVKNRLIWLATFIIGIMFLIFIEVVIPGGIMIVEAIEGNSSDNIPVLHFTPGEDEILVKNNSGHVLRDIQYQIPLYECKDNMPGRYYSLEEIEDSECVPLRGAFGMQETLRFVASYSATSMISPGEQVELSATGGNFNYILSIRYPESNFVTEGYHMVETDPVFIGGVN